MASTSGAGAATASTSQPITKALQVITGLRALAAEAPVANNLLAGLIAEVLAANEELQEQLERFGWQHGQFTQTVDLHGLASVLQKHMYERLGQLGAGSYGVVYRARNRETHEVVAIKK